MKESVSSFLSNVLSVILGIAITFAVQGMIDRSRDRKDVRSALELVRSELQSNVRDIGIMADYLRQERASAQYLLDHRKTLDRCPQDSVDYHSGIIFADASITVSCDALELLKMSSLFQKIGDGILSMKIIRAYDTCSSVVSNLNRHVTVRNAQFERSITEKTAGQFASSGVIDVRDYVKTGIGLYALRWLATQADVENYSDVSDLEDAIRAIDRYMGGRRNQKK